MMEILWDRFFTPKTPSKYFFKIYLHDTQPRRSPGSYPVQQDKFDNSKKSSPLIGLQADIS
jgi:hypothetical protein